MRRTPAALAVSALIATTGCGGGALSKSGYAAKADAICAVANKKEAAAGAPGPGWVYERAFSDVSFLKRFNAPGREAVRELRALKPPTAERASATAMVAAIAKMVHALDGRIADLEAGKGSGSNRARAYLVGYSDLTPAAAVLGLSECQGVSL